MKKISLTILGFLLSNELFAASTLTTEDLQKAAKVAVDTFKDQSGEALYKAIYAIQTMHSKDHNDRITVKVFYRREGVSKTAEYFCHYEKSKEFDCHDL